MRSLAVLFVTAAAAGAWPPQYSSSFSLPPPSIREFEVPQPPLVIERPPRVFREVTQTFEVTPRQTIDLSAFARPQVIERPVFVPVPAARQRVIEIQTQRRLFHRDRVRVRIFD